jgi:2-oxoglutarate ferredoxin oxidoreductase subunit alpha
MAKTTKAAKIINKLSWKMGGPAGEGIMSAGMIFAKCATRGGLNTYNYIEYPSLIKGGHNTYQVQVGADEVFFVSNKINLLVALDKETIDRHSQELNPGGGIIYDGEKINLDAKDYPQIKLYSVPLEAMALERKNRLLKNTIALGANLALLDYDLEILLSMISDIFKRKGEAIVKMNTDAARAGYDYIKNNFKADFGFKLEKMSNQPKMVISGNEAIACGMQAAGCKFFPAYPMTPATSILHFLKAKERDYNMVVVQTEDEISALAMAIGANYAGVRSATATSGGGFSLMVEHLGLSGITETPVVVVNSQRPGPATGLPTWTEQADLRFLIHAAQGEFSRIILAPGDANEAFYLTAEAFNLAEKYQIPVIVLSDKLLSESYESTDEFDLSKVKIERGEILSDADLASNQNYLRYKITASGISPRSLPGQANGISDTNSDEHDEYGFSTEESEMRIKMMNKRFSKMEAIRKEIIEPKIYGDKKAKITLIGWGSTKKPILESLKLFKEKGIVVRFLHFTYLWPLPEKQIKKILTEKGKTFILENNHDGQLAALIKEITGLEPDHQILKYDGRPFWPEEIVERVRKFI